MELKETIAQTNVWNPCTQLKDYDELSPLKIKSAKGSYLCLDNGQKVLDAIGSWWCKLLGHGHPRLLEALKNQADQFEHVMTGYVSYDAMEHLSSRLCMLTHLDKAYYASDGACSVEVALKMAHQAKRLQGVASPKIMTLENAYHGETCGALSVTDLPLFNEAYQGLIFDVDVLRGLPYVRGAEDALWHDCSSVWPQLEAQLNQSRPDVLIVEPIIQSAGGMLIYSADCLRRLSWWARQHDCYLIVDEIMTGFGRTGKWFAYQHADIQPDFVCLGKGLTGGVLPMSAVLTSDRVFQHFYDRFESGKTFFHSHTYSGNALGVAVANACLDELIEHDWIEKTAFSSNDVREALQDRVGDTSAIKNPRVLGAMAAFDVDLPIQRPSYQIFKEALKRSALIRPLGSTVYATLPLNADMIEWADFISIAYDSVVHFL